MVIFASFGFLFWSLRVFNLKNHYPYFDKKNEAYQFSDKKPKRWIELDKISKNVREAIIVSEDWAFYDHNGIDFLQLKLVLKEALDTGELSRGASTITAQLVKNTLLSNERSIFRKVLEYYYVYLTELILTKDQILERYLNIIELGPNIYGVKEGAYYYFKKSASKLTLREAAFLAMLLPSPIKYSVSFEDKELTKFANEQIESILIKLRQKDFINEEQRVEAMKQRFLWELPASSPVQFNFYGDEDFEL